jgi:hypothetical protein
VEDDALLCRSIELQAIYHHDVEEVRWREAAPELDPDLRETLWD